MDETEAYLHLRYSTFLKIYNKTKKDEEALAICLDALVKVEAMNQLLEGVKEDG